MYIVIKTFYDSEDDNFCYEIGRPYQRMNAKKEASEERIKYLIEQGAIIDREEFEDEERIQDSIDYAAHGEDDESEE